MKFTQVATTAFQKLQLNAGVLLSEFTPGSTLDKTKILAATGGGITFEAVPQYKDFGDGIDNVPKNTKELKKLDYFEAKMSGTAKTVDTAFAKMLTAAADVTSGTGKVTPRADLSSDDFDTIWWVGDYSDYNGDNNGGYVAIKLINALSTGGFKVKSNDKDKGEFAFEFMGHYSMSDTSIVPFEIYIKAGTAEPTAKLSALTLGSLTLSPTFSADTTEYTTATTDATNTITATGADSASVSIKNGTTTVTSGNAATWVPGANTVTITVTKTGYITTVYTVVVTKS